jgi:hypothetical protein
MPRRSIIALFVLVLSLVAVPIAHASDRSKFDSLIGKNAIDDPAFTGHFNPKVGCVCQTDPTPAPGFLVRLSGDVYCANPIFAGDGSFATYSTCSVYLVLPK